VLRAIERKSKTSLVEKSTYPVRTHSFTYLVYGTIRDEPWRHHYSSTSVTNDKRFRVELQRIGSTTLVLQCSSSLLASMSEPTGSSRFDQWWNTQLVVETSQGRRNNRQPSTSSSTNC